MLTTAVIGSLLPYSLHGFGILVVLLLAGLDVLLIDATEALAFAWRRPLDERERTLRDLAYRRGFRLLGLAAILEIILVIATGILSAVVGPSSVGGLTTTAISNGITGRALVVVVQLLVMTPTMVIAWSDLDHDIDEASRRSRPRRLAWFALPALIAGWAALLTLGPEQTVPASSNVTFVSSQGATCNHFARGRLVDAEFGATVGMRAEVRWNGHDAWVIGDPRIPLPRSAIDGMLAAMPPEERAAAPAPRMFNPDDPDLSGCGLDNSDDFATVSSTTCTGVIDIAGTLHYSVHAVVSGPAGVGRRDVTLTLVVDRNGHVLQWP